MPLNLGRISFNVWPLCTGLISALLSIIRVRHKCTLPLILSFRTKLLDHSDVSLTPRAPIICCFYSLSRSSFRDSWSTYPTLVGDIWYDQLPSLTYKLNVPSKHPICDKKNLTEFIIYLLC